MTNNVEVDNRGCIIIVDDRQWDGHPEADRQGAELRLGKCGHDDDDDDDHGHRD